MYKQTKKNMNLSHCKIFLSWHIEPINECLLVPSWKLYLLKSIDFMLSEKNDLLISLSFFYLWVLPLKLFPCPDRISVSMILSHPGRGRGKVFFCFFFVVVVKALAVWVLQKKKNQKKKKPLLFLHLAPTGCTLLLRNTWNIRMDKRAWLVKRRRKRQ